MYSSVNHGTLTEIARILGGEEGVEIINVLKDVDEITVEDLAQKTNIQVNYVRKILYTFYNHSLVTSRRFRDRETGWFIFQWRLQPELLEAYVRGIKHKILKKLQSRLEFELQHMFYQCENPSCPRTTFEDAMDTVFRCPICGGTLSQVDNKSTILFLEKKVAEIEEELEN